MFNKIILCNKIYFFSYLKACDPEHYGANCTKTCTCPSNRCNPKTGECQCAAPGKQPPDCSKNCTNGTYGLNCRGICFCQNGASCDPVDGTCDCRDGFQGDKCQNNVTTTRAPTTGKSMTPSLHPLLSPTVEALGLSLSFKGS